MSVHWTEISPALSDYGPFGAVNKAWYYSRDVGTGVQLILLLGRVLPGLMPQDYAWLAQTVAEGQQAGAILASLAPGEEVPLDAIPIVPGSAHGGAGGRRVRISGGLERRDPATGETERVGGFSLEEPAAPDLDRLNKLLDEISQASTHPADGGGRDTMPGSLADDIVESDWELSSYGVLMMREY